MHTRSLTVAALVTGLSLIACGDDAALAPRQDPGVRAEAAAASENPELSRVLATLRRATARYHDVEAARADGFIQVAECEDDPVLGGMGIPYANIERLLDGKVDPSRPDALLYTQERSGKLTLVAVELAVPKLPGSEAPRFFGVPFQAEDELGVYGLHVWLWRQNPNGLFAEFNPRVSCSSME